MDPFQLGTLCDCVNCRTRPAYTRLFVHQRLLTRSPRQHLFGGTETSRARFPRTWRCCIATKRRPRACCKKCCSKAPPSPCRCAEHGLPMPLDAEPLPAPRRAPHTAPAERLLCADGHPAPQVTRQRPGDPALSPPFREREDTKQQLIAAAVQGEPGTGAGGTA